MGLLGFSGLIAIAAGIYWWALLPRLRKLAWWDGFVARLWALLKGVYVRLRGLCGNSRTIAVAYAAEILGILDEARGGGLVGAPRRRGGRPRHGDHGRGDDPAASPHPHRGDLPDGGLAPC